MPAYLVAEHLIADAERFEAYRRKVAPMIERYGGRYLTRGGSHRVLDGAWHPTRAVIIEFPDMAALMRWYESPEYQPLIALRRGAGTDVLLAIDGVPGGAAAATAGEGETAS
ncbi:MAG: DUF1330 domain-containing protein [Burkholderiales bacterium]|nr:DUF1330 domain-containing protein [Burkholderiales bacterium]